LSKPGRNAKSEVGINKSKATTERTKLPPTQTHIPKRKNPSSNFWYVFKIIEINFN